MKKSQSILLTVLFCAFLGAVAVLTLALPKREFSEFENRYLQTAPKFSYKTVKNGKFMEDAEEYISDHIVLRDFWVALKAASERALGKGENNGVYFCKNDTLIRRVSEPDPAMLTKKAGFVSSLADDVEIPVYLGLIPTAAEVYAELLPADAPTADEKAAISSVYAQTSAQGIDLLTPLTEGKEELLFYRTDHHWTSRGAFLGANAILEAMGLEPLSRDDFTPQTVSDTFYGTVWSSSGAQWVEPDSIEIFVPEDGLSVQSYRNNALGPATLYVPEKLETKDKYSYFLGGNQPICIIGTQTDGPKLLLVRDSYSDCLAPFLTRRFSEIHLIDLRYYHMSLRDYIRENGIDDAVILYGFSMFADDSYLAFLTK